MTKILIGSLVTVFLLPACGLSKKKPEPLVVTSDFRLAGRVHKIDQAGKFVLIRRYRAWRLNDGDLVESRGGGRAANLQATGERLGEHIAADIRSGNVEVGDGVYIRKVETPQEPKKSDDPENSAQADNHVKSVNKP